MLGAANPKESDFALVVRLDRGNHGFITRSSRCGTRSGARRPGMAAIRNDYRHPAARGSLPKLSAAAGANLRALPDAENPSPNGDGFRAVDEAEMRNRYRWIFSDRILIMTRGNGHRTALCLDALSPRVYSGETDKPASSIIALVGRCFARRTRPWTRDDVNGIGGHDLVEVAAARRAWCGLWWLFGQAGPSQDLVAISTGTEGGIAGSREAFSVPLPGWAPSRPAVRRRSFRQGAVRVFAATAAPARRLPPG